MATGSGTVGPRTASPMLLVAVGAPARPLRSSILSAWSEARPAVQIMFQLRIIAVVAVASLYAGADPRWTAVALCCAGWLCITWSIYLLNGLADRVEDRMNGSSRPLARGTLDAGVARHLVPALACVGVVLCSSAGRSVLVSALVMLALGFLYSAGPAPLKNRVWGVQVSVFGGGLTTYAAGVCAAGTEVSPAVIVFAIAMSAWMGVGGLAKDLSDVEGDRAAGRSTLAMWSESGTCVVIASLAGIICVGFAVSAWTVEESLIVPALVLGCGAAALAACAVAGRSRRRHVRTPYNAFMYSQYGAHTGVLCILL
ncbi:UbiA family prenyltransferase [Rhodococcus fascians]|nr:UbiA family prenyltransferase [Rhodococcus fascians]MBY4239722.1 UbiA family prenyltransferase [Rhodococcus fascians]MBY4255228.1 UbiA family prenyltransferase [Rhodococcus fascians]MBY4271084.1 UbiA family prenyltransferase [Rhodococcus fascians]